MPSEEPQPDLEQSPEPVVEDSSPSTPEAQEAAPETKVGSTAESPPASEKEQAKPDETGDILDRLTIEEPKQTVSPKEEAGSDEPPPEIDDEVEYKAPDEKELAGYHSRTRKRIKQLMRHHDDQIGQMKPYAEFGQTLIQQAAENDISVNSLQQWINVGHGVRSGNPQALAALQEVLESHGYSPKASAAAADYTPIEAVVKKLYDQMELSDEARTQFQEAIKRSREMVPAQPVQQPIQPQRQQFQPQTPPAQPQQPSAFAQTVQWIQREEQKLTNQYGEKYKEMRPKILAEAARREKDLSLAERNDPYEMRARFAACAAHVIAVTSQAAKKQPVHQVQPTLRANKTPTPTSLPKMGTPEYDDYILTHGVP